MEDDDDDHKEREFYPKRENATALHSFMESNVPRGKLFFSVVYTEPCVQCPRRSNSKEFRLVCGGDTIYD